MKSTTTRIGIAAEKLPVDVPPESAPPRPEEEHPTPQGGADRVSRLAIIGVPNVGKSLLFRRLTGEFAASGNYPHTTHELERARVRLGDRDVELIDTPGASGFEYCSEDEAPTRDLLRDAPPDVIIQCVDAANLRRSLVLTAQLADADIPMVLCLNMVDEALARGTFVDGGALSALLQVPVVTVCAQDGRGLAKLPAAVAEARRPLPVEYPDWLQEKLDRLPAGASRAQRIDEIMGRHHEDAEPGQSVWHMVLEAHHDRANEIAQQVVRPTGLDPRTTIWNYLERVALHPLGGWLLLAVTLAGMYLLVAEIGVGLLADGMDRYLDAPVINAVADALGPGVLSDILVGEFGLLSLGLFNAICTVLPILAVFYLAFGFLEDVGYFPLLSVQLDRSMRRMGLTGRAVLPITLAFGCNSVATMATRSLHSERQRFIACFLIALGIPCAVQLGVMVAILSTAPVAALLGLVGVVSALMVVSGALLARMMPALHDTDFLVELPPLRPPRWRNILAKTHHRLIEFFVEACPIFIASAAVLLVLQFTGLLERIRDGLAPVVEGVLGLPRECADMLLMTLARREVGAVMMKDMVDAGMLDLQQIFVGLLVMTLFVPCLTNTLLVGRVVGWRKATAIFFSVIAIAIASGAVANAVWQ